MWALGRRAVAGLPSRTASRASVSVGIPRWREPVGACGHRGLQVTISSASAFRHSVSTRAALPSAGRVRPYAQGALCAHAPGHTRRLRGLWSSRGRQAVTMSGFAQSCTGRYLYEDFSFSH